MNSSDSGFLSRWSRRKMQAQQGVAPSEPAAPDIARAVPAAALTTGPRPEAAPPVPAGEQAGTVAQADERPAPPTLADVAALTRESDYSRFVAPEVSGEVKNAALKKLFGDPRFNVMDGLDVYIDDYSKPDPLPLSSVRKMAQAAFLGLIDPDPPVATPPTAAAQAPNAPDVDAVAPAGATPEPDENADLRLQSHDATGCGGAEDGAAAVDPSRL